MYLDQCYRKFVTKTSENTFKFLQKRCIPQCTSIDPLNTHSSNQKNSRRRVVVTGLGVVSPVGCDTKSAWENIIKGYCGIKTLNDRQYESLPCRIAAKIDENDLKLQDTFSNTEIRSIATASLYALIAGSCE